MIIFLSFTFNGCSSTIKVFQSSYEKELIKKRNDVLSNGKLSDYTKETIQIIGEDSKLCQTKPKICIDKLISKSNSLNDSSYYSALSELWMLESVNITKDYPNKVKKLHIPALINSVRNAYFYLFYTKEKLADRSLDNRQNQIKDYYNYGIEKLTSFFLEDENIPLDKSLNDKIVNFNYGKYNINVNFNFDIDSLTLGHIKNLSDFDFVPTSSLSFKGINNIYTNDGIGSVFSLSPKDSIMKYINRNNLSEKLVFPSLSILFSFDENKDVINIFIYDSFKNKATTINNNTKVKLAANYTANYGLWMNKIDFANNPYQPYLIFLFKKLTNSFVEPKLFLMQQFDPNKRIIILIHGLASSPITWINVANDIIGDSKLRNNYQIWQIYYPTNLPIAINHIKIREKILEVLNQLDPSRKSIAANNIVIIGHSMGGIIARLLVSKYTEEDINNFIYQHKEKHNIKALKPYLLFNPLNNVHRVIFIATPHRGTSFKDNYFSLLISKLTNIPVQVLNTLNIVNDNGYQNSISFNSIDSLSNRDPTMEFFNNITIPSYIKYNSIIANNTPKKPLLEIDDNYVSYSSAHLDGAESELIVNSDHGAQNRPDTILEIRRILKESLKKD